MVSGDRYLYAETTLCLCVYNSAIRPQYSAWRRTTFWNTITLNNAKPWACLGCIKQHGSARSS